MLIEIKKKNIPPRNNALVYKFFFYFTEAESSVYSV